MSITARSGGGNGLQQRLGVGGSREDVMVVVGEQPGEAVAEQDGVFSNL
jgi:hypothetical protein